MEYYLVFPCIECDEDFYYGINVTLLEHRGFPAIPFDIAAQTIAKCSHCGTRNVTGDFDLVNANEL